MGLGGNLRPGRWRGGGQGSVEGVQRRQTSLATFTADTVVSSRHTLCPSRYVVSSHTKTVFGERKKQFDASEPRAESGDLDSSGGARQQGGQDNLLLVPPSLGEGDT